MSNDTQHNGTPAPEAPAAPAPAAPAAPAAPGPEPSATPPSQEDEDLEAQLAYENLKRRREARKRKRIIIAAIVGVVVLVIAIVFVIGRTNQAADQTNQEAMATGSVYEGDFATTVTANGATEPVKTTVVSPEVDGIVEDLQVQEGDTVKQGDVLFTMKNETLDKEVHTAETELSAAQRAADSANRAISDAYDAYNKAVNDYNNAAQNAVQVAAPGEDGTTVETVTTFDDSSLRSAISSAEDAYKTAQDAVDAAQEKLDDAKRNADKRVVRAPVPGTIVSLNAKNGTTYGASSGASGSAGVSSGSDGSLMQISDLSTMKVTVQVNEVDISKISKGQEATATFLAIPGLELDATVEHIASVSSSSGAASTEGGSGGVVTYAVDLIIPKPDPALKPGMTATVNIITQSAPNSLIVPAAAVQDGMGEDGTPNKYVTVVDDEQSNKTHDVTVEVVAENSSEAAVKGNLKDGDKVLLGAAGATGAGDAAGNAGDATVTEVAV